MKPRIRQSGADWMRHLLLAWLLGITAEYLLLPEPYRALSSLEGLSHMVPLRVLLTGAGAAGILGFLGSRRDLRRAERWAMLGTFLLLAFACSAASFSWPFFCVCTVISAGLLVFGLYGWDRGQALEKKNICLWAAVMGTVVFFLFVSIWTVSRVTSYCTSTYDLGLFSQMFHYMKTTGRPLTTLERDGLLSHFHVHLSPIFYLLLPFYALAPGPECLQILQAGILASSVIPLWKLGTRHGLSDRQKLLLSGILLLYPAFSGGASYDLHENCFLTPLLLWLLYGLDAGKLPVTVTAALLTLMVKEDGAVYVAVAGLFVLTRGLLHRKEASPREISLGAGLFLGALIWFLGASVYLKHTGEGIMSYRYDNFLYGQSDSLLTLVSAVFLNPMKAVYECVDREKLQYIGLTLLPLLGLPLLTRRYERYLLLIPYVLINLMPDYPYQHDIFFQYSFGSLAFLFYLVMVNLADLKQEKVRGALLCVCLVLTGLCFAKTVVPRATPYMEWQQANRQEIREIDELLSEIPPEAPVSSVTYYTPRLSGRDILYDVEYSTLEHILETEYVVLSDEVEYETWVEGGISGKEDLLKALGDHGFTLWKELPGRLAVYHAARGE